jgi:prepilin-type N-terminal cleavage/methylation domain-containing protein
MNRFRARSRQGNRGEGFSLLEVILAMAILGGALVVIGYLVNLGYKHALSARLRSEANILCDTKMSEVAAGVLDLEAVSSSPIEESPDWNYSVFIEPSGQNGLLLVTVRVANNQTGSVPVTVEVARFMPDPDYDPEKDAE